MAHFYFCRMLDKSRILVIIDAHMPAYSVPVGLRFLSRRKKHGTRLRFAIIYFVADDTLQIYTYILRIMCKFDV